MMINMEILLHAARRQHLLEEAAAYRRIREAKAVKSPSPHRTRKEMAQRIFNRPEKAQV